MSTSHTRRFVQSAWTLLSFQLVASVGAVAVTGLAAFHVQRMASELQAMRGEPAIEVTEAALAPEAPGGPQTTASAPEASAPTEVPADPASGPTEVPADPAAITGEAPAQAAAQAIAPCERQRSLIRVQANAGWCDTGIQATRGARLIFAAQGQWSDTGEHAYGPAGAGQRVANTVSAEAPLGALVGRVGDQVFTIGERGTISTRADGRLHLSFNDTPGGFADNQGFVDVFLQSPQ